MPSVPVLLGMTGYDFEIKKNVHIQNFVRDVLQSRLVVSNLIAF